MKDDQFEQQLLELVRNASERDKRVLFTMLTAICYARGKNEPLRAK